MNLNFFDRLEARLKPYHSSIVFCAGVVVAGLVISLFADPSVIVRKIDLESVVVFTEDCGSILTIDLGEDLNAEYVIFHGDIAHAMTGYQRGSFDLMMTTFRQHMESVSLQRPFFGSLNWESGDTYYTPTPIRDTLRIE